jgi:HEAT repeats
MPIFKGSTDFYWTASVWVSLVTIALMAFVILALLLLKRRRMQQRQKDLDFDQHWQGLMISTALGDATTLPAFSPLSKDDQWRLLKLWIRMQMMLEGAARDRLRVLGQELNLHAVALHYFHSHRRPEQLLSLMCLGFLKDNSVWHEIEQMLHDKSRSISMHAAWALLALDGEKAAAHALEVLMDRSEGDLVQASSLFKPFAGLLHQAWHQEFIHLNHLQSQEGRSQSLVRLLRIAIALEMPIDDQLLLPLLSTDTDIEELLAALKLVNTTTSISVICEQASNPNWQVRTQVASALGRLGSIHELPVLEKLITDSQWWVRYRAAQAIIHSQWLTDQELLVRAANWTDRFAKDMIQQVIAERQNYDVE